MAAQQQFCFKLAGPVRMLAQFGSVGLGVGSDSKLKAL